MHLASPKLPTQQMCTRDVLFILQLYKFGFGAFYSKQVQSPRIKV